jgi:hypothetical protein
MRGCGRSAFAVAVCLVGWAAVARGEDAPVLLFQGGGARDVAVAPGGDTIYVAVYQANEVLAIDSADGSVRGRARVGAGPSALAAVDGDLVVLSRTGASLAILSALDLSAKATVPVSPGTSAIFAAGPRRIVTVNPLAGEAGVVDLAMGAIVKTATLADAVPAGGVFGGGRIAIIGHAPAVVWTLDADSLDVILRRELPSAPRAIASMADGRFIVATDDALILLDGSSLEIIRTAALAASGLAASSEGVLCVTGGGMRAFTAGLDAQESWPLPEGAVALRWAGPALVTWSPSLGRVWRVRAAPVRVAAAPVGEAVPTTPVIVALPVTQMARVDAAPAADAPPAASARGSSPRQEDVEASRPEYSLTVRPTRLHLGGFQPYAPRFGDPTGRTFDEELARALDFSHDEDSLTHVDFDKRLDKLIIREGASIRGTGQGATAQLDWEGGVDLMVDGVHVTAERLEKASDPSELVLEGATKLERGASSLTADRIRAFDAWPPTIPGVWPLVPSRGQKAVPHPLVPRGYLEPEPRPRSPLGAVEMQDVVWVEPQRRLEADRLEVNALRRRSSFLNPEGQAGPLYFGAQSLEVRTPMEILGQDLWVTTCDLPVPHYRLRLSRVESEGSDRLVVSSARLQLGKINTPLYVPRLTAALLPGERRLGTDLDIGGASSLGSFINVAQWFRVNPNVELAPRVYATAKKGIGIGLDGKYDYMNDPSSPLFRSRGEFETLYTTEEDGYTHWYHRQELTPDTVLLGQWEQWYEQDVIKEFHRDEYESRAGPRSFVSVARTRPQYLATATVAPSLHGFTEETEKLPELTFHLFERELGAGLYGTFDGAAGYYETRPETVGAVRTVTVGRLSYDWNVARGLNVLPFVEVEGTYYSDTLDDGRDAFRGTTTVGVTAQARTQRTFAGVGNFTGFKHLIIPSATLSFRPDATLAAEDTPRFDALDSRPGRFRIESTLDNIVLGKNAPTGEVWPVTRLTLYQGNDLENEAIRSNDYEMDLQVRPRPAWGLQAIGEIHQVNESPGLPGEDFSRLLTYVFYDDKLGKNKVNGRVGFAYTESADNVLNQEILYGVGYRISGRWSAAFEQRYDFERDELTRQSYWVRHKLHDWEVALGIRARQSSVDVVIQINLVNFPEIGM